MPTTTPEKALKIFLSDRKIQGHSPRTIDFYEDSAGLFIRWIVASHPEATLEELPALTVDYFLDLRTRELSAYTQHTYGRGIKTFLRWLASEEFIPGPIKITVPRKPKLHIQPLTVAQMRQSLREVDMDQYEGLRLYAMLRTFYDTGIRVSELWGIRMHELDLQGRWILVHGKGAKDRSVPFGNETKKAIWAYMIQREKYAREDNSLWLTRSGTQIKLWGIKTAIRRLGERLGWEGVRFSAHTFRHSFALAYIENGGDPFSLQKILGHEDGEMTSHYVHMAKRDVERQHEKFSPGNDL